MKKLSLFILPTLILISLTLPLKASDGSPYAVNSHPDLSKTSKELANDVMVIAPVDEPKLRWGDDRLIYNGDVNANSWAVMVDNVDDEAIDVDYSAGDTLRAVVACADSILRIFRSSNNGQTWIARVAISKAPFTEPRIVHGTDSTYHIFTRNQGAQGSIYTAGFRTADDLFIAGTGQVISGTDSVKSYSVCTRRANYHNYGLFVVYHQGLGGRGNDQIIFTSSNDQGQTWSTPDTIFFNGAMYPDIKSGDGIMLYMGFLGRLPASNLDEIVMCRSSNTGTTWDLDVIESDSFPKMRPQIEAAHNDEGSVWAIWSKKDLNTPNDDWGLRWSWSQDSAVTWSTPGWTNSIVDSNEVLPSIALYDGFGSTSTTPYVSFIKSYYDWTGSLSVRTFEWGGSNWGADTCFSDSNAFLTRPISAFIQAGAPAIAYVGENSHNVYFDSWSNTSGIEEDDEIISSNGKIQCSLSQSIITGNATLNYILPFTTNVDIYVVNVIGQTVATLDSGEKDAGGHTLAVSVENLSQGIYYIVIETENGLKGISKAAVLK